MMCVVVCVLPCCLLVAVRCSLSVAGCVLSRGVVFVVRCAMFVVDWKLSVVC